MRLGLITLALFFTAFLAAQNYESRIHYKVKLGDTTQLHQLILLDYSKLLGVALEADAVSIRFQLRSTSEVSVIPTNQLRFLGVFTSGEKGKGGNGTNAPSSELTDLTYEPTALPYNSKGEVKIINLLYATTEWNLNEHFQLGVGLAGPLGILATQRARWSLSPLLHVGVSNKMLYVPVAAVFNDRVPLLGDAHLMLTVGNNRRFLNLGTGVLYDNSVEDGTAWGHRMAFGARLSDRWTVYSEALMILTKERRFRERNVILLPTFNAALRIRKHRWNFGIATVREEGFDFFPPPIPYIGYSYFWGNIRAAPNK
ncbi:hypothetical protein FUA23_14265 [Neolewinella aurantiaca]|uniref:Uncharacterized protein n=1 Tax=Neolewinella aurantiaca TaxID=2602767 RepID=A0A5C7FMF5_9BACT|nr:hypothetical protein [Neolewinella aurantiaca]TXF88626.1 hypothetical protein FUA23_14265 [Neolewinella aurantiaca]